MSKSKSLSALSKMSSSLSKISTSRTTARTYKMEVNILVNIIFNLLVIMYIVNLEDKSCNCIYDWRHDYIKYFSCILVVLGMFTLLVCVDRTSILAKLLKFVLFIGFLVNAYCLFTYIGDLDNKHCKCAVEQQKAMHYFLYLWRYVLVASIVIGCILCLINVMH